MSGVGYGGGDGIGGGADGAAGGGGFQSGQQGGAQNPSPEGVSTGGGEAPKLTPELQAQFDALQGNPQFKSWYDAQGKAKQAPTAQPAQQQGVTPEVQAILDRMLPPPAEVKMEPGAPLTSETYQQMQQRERLVKFQNDVKGIFSRPFDVGGVTIDMTDPRRAQGLMNFVREFVNRAPTAREIATLHLLGELMAGARDSAGRRAETAMQRTSIRGGSEGQEPRVVVPPATKAKQTSPNKVPNLAELVAADDGITGDQWLSNWNRKTVLGQ